MTTRDVPAGTYRLRYEPGAAIVTLANGTVMTIKADADQIVTLTPGGAAPTIKLVAGRLGLHPILGKA